MDGWMDGCSKTFKEEKEENRKWKKAAPAVGAFAKYHERNKNKMKFFLLPDYNSIIQAC